MKQSQNHGWIGAALCLAAGACGGQPAAPEPPAETGEIRLLVTVDWEGSHLYPHDLAAMTELRNAFPQVPLVQFLNAAYFTKPNADNALITQQISSTLRDGDELGFHVHAWKTLFEAAGVTFRYTPTVWDGDAGQISEAQCTLDCGHEVPINAYTQQELASVFRFSLDTLEANGFGRARSFRSGAWLGEPHVLSALASEGVFIDSSAVYAPFLFEELSDVALYDWVAALWPDITIDSQPYLHEGITEVPDNGALADYVTGEEMFSVYLAAKQRLQDDPTQDALVNIGFHQETAKTYLPRVHEALTLILADAEQTGTPLHFGTMEQVIVP